MGSDMEDRSAVTAFKVPVSRGQYAQRSLFVIDPQGILRYVNYRYRIGADYPDVLKTLEEIGGG